MYTALIFIYFFGKWVKFSNIWLSLYYWQTESSPPSISFSFAFSALFSSYSSSFSSFPSSFSYSSPPPITVFPSSSCQWLSMGSWSSPDIACVNSFSLNSASSVKYFSEKVNITWHGLDTVVKSLSSQPCSGSMCKPMNDHLRTISHHHKIHHRHHNDNIPHRAQQTMHHQA